MMLHQSCHSPISIHAPREGGDIVSYDPRQPFYISIHAPREGGDCSMPLGQHLQVYFNPRPPRGGRQRGTASPQRWTPFQSTPPARGATQNSIWCISSLIFQSTPPARGATLLAANTYDILLLFQSTPPARGATNMDMTHNAYTLISIHAPREGGDLCQISR